MRHALVLTVLAACGQASAPVSLPAKPPGPPAQPAENIHVSAPSKETADAARAVSGLRVYTFLGPGTTRDQVNGYLRELAADAQIPVAAVAADRYWDRALAKRFKVVRDGTVVVTSGSRVEKIVVGGQRAREDLLRLDERLAKALAKLVAPTRRLLLVRASAEGGPDGWNSRTLQLIGEHLSFDVVDTTRSGTTMDPTSDILLVTDSGHGSTGDTLQTVIDFAAKGGNILYALESVEDRTLGDLGAALGLRYHPRRLAESAAREPAASGIIATNRILEHDATALSAQRDAAAIAFFSTGYFELLQATACAPLVSSLNSAYVDKNRNKKRDEGELQKSFTLAVACKLGESRLVFLADSTLLESRYLERFYDAQLFLADNLRWLGKLPAPKEAKPLSEITLRSYPTAQAALDERRPPWDAPPSRLRNLTFRRPNYDLQVRANEGALHGELLRVSKAAPDGKRQRFTVDEKLPALVARPRVVRSLGVLSNEKREEFGIDGSRQLEVTFGGVVHTLLFGHTVYGGADRYAFEPVSGRGYVVDAKLFQLLGGAPHTLK